MNQSIAISTKGKFEREDHLALPLYSIAKTYIAATVIAAGIDPEAKVSQWIDASWCQHLDSITVAQLLNHTSGLTDYGHLPAYSEAIKHGTIWSDDDFANYTLRQPLLFKPGSQFAYSNPGYWLLNQILQHHTGLSFRECINKWIVQPLGLQHTSVVEGVFADDLPDYPASWVWHGLLTAPPGEVIRFMNSVLVQELTRKQTLQSVVTDQSMWNNPNYGYGLMVDRSTDSESDPAVTQYGHNGEGPGYSASCFHFTDTGKTICVLMPSNQPDAAMRLLLELV